MKDLTKYFIDLSKLSEEGQKDIISLLPEPEVKQQYIIGGDFKYLHYDGDFGWWVDKEFCIADKTELTYPDFIKLFEGGEGETQVEHTCKYCGCLTTQPDNECYAAPKNKMETLYRKQL